MVSLRFRWVFCQLELLRQCLPPSVRHILTELPETLDGTYERILQEIPKSNRVHAHRLLQCLTVAVRPLHVEELAEVLAIDFDATGGTPKLNEDLRWEDQEQAVLSACSSFISVVWDDDSQVFQFSHFSVKEFLTSDRLATSTIVAARDCHILLEPSHTIMAQACLSILLRLDSNINEDSLKDFPLARYASEHFGDHAEFGNVFTHIRDGIDDLLDADKSIFATWLWVRTGNFDVPPKRPIASPLYHIAGFGFRSMVNHLISKRPEDLSVRGPYGIPLHAALCNGHGSVALAILSHCVDVDVRGFEDRTPLHMAVDHGLLEVTRILTERGANINARDSRDRTPLHPTSGGRSGTFDDTYFDVVRYLLDHGADVDARAHTEHSTPLHLASYWGGFKVAQLLLDRGVDTNLRDEQCRTPLHEVLSGLADSSHDYFVDVVRFLLDHGADVGAEDDGHSTPLHVISQYGNIKAAGLLLEHGARVDALNSDHSTPLHFASHGGHAQVARLLLQHGAEVDPRDGNHSTPLHLASRGSLSPAEVVRLLLEHGAEVDARDGNHSTPLHFASERAKAEVARLLLEHGADVHAQNNNKSTPLHFISQYGDDGAARVLIEHGAVVDARDNKDSTPLHVASQCGNVEVARLLLKHGANVHVRNKEDQTPRHLLLANWSDESMEDDIDTIRFFLDCGADVDAIDDEDHSTLLHVASYHGCVKVAQLLLEHGANTNVRNGQRQTPLHRALVRIKDEFGDRFFNGIRLLLEHGADVDALDDENSTPLHVASQRGSVKATRLLLEHGANVDLQNNEGHTPCQVASAKGHEKIARLLSEHSQSEQKM